MKKGIKGDKYKCKKASQQALLPESRQTNEGELDWGGDSEMERIQKKGWEEEGTIWSEHGLTKSDSVCV